MKTLPLASGERDGMETWKQHHISQQVCKAESEKPLQKPAHSDLCNWCLSRRRAKPPGNSADQAPWTRRDRADAPHGRHPQGCGCGKASGSQQETHSNSCWHACLSRSSRNGLSLHVSKPKQASQLKGIEQWIQKSLEQNKKLINSFLLQRPDGFYSSTECSGVKEGDLSPLSPPALTVPRSPTQGNSTQRKRKVPGHFPWKKSKSRKRCVYLIAFSRNNICTAILLLLAMSYFLSPGALCPDCKRPRECLCLLRLKTTPAYNWTFPSLPYSGGLFCVMQASVNEWRINCQDNPQEDHQFIRTLLTWSQR